MKSTFWTLILSLCSLAISIIMIIIYISKANAFSYADPISYLSAVLGLIALFVAVGLGYQIYNGVELSSQIAKTRNVVDDKINGFEIMLSKTGREIEILNLKKEAELSYMVGVQMSAMQAYIQSLNYYLKSISLYLKLYKLTNDRDCISSVKDSINDSMGSLYIIGSFLSRTRGIYTCRNKSINYDDIEFLIDERKEYIKSIIKSDNYELISAEFQKLLKSIDFVFLNLKEKKGIKEQELKEYFGIEYHLFLC